MDCIVRAYLTRGRLAEHIMLMYDEDSDRDLASMKYINESLAKGAFTIYASVSVHEPVMIDYLRNSITNFDKHIAKGNLMLVRFKRFYDQALKNSLEPFKDLKVILETILEERTKHGQSTKVVAVADCADQLSRNQMFDECVMVEKWWQDTHNEWLDAGKNITVICPHPAEVLRSISLNHRKQQISNLHSVTLSIPKR